MIFPFALTVAAVASDCLLDVPPDGPFAHRLPPLGAQQFLIVEVDVRDGNVDGARALLDMLDQRGLQGTWVAKPEAPAPEMTLLLAEAAGRGHEVAAAVPATAVPEDPLGRSSELRKGRKALSKAVGAKVRAVATDASGQVPESHLGRAGYRSLLATVGPSTPTARPAQVFEGQPRNGVVLPTGPYAGPCGRSHTLGPFRPPTADRVASALHGSLRSPGARVVRVGLAAADGSIAAPVFGRWIDEVARPAGVQVAAPSAVRRAALSDFHRPSFAPDRTPVDLGGRMVPLSDLQAAAVVLGEATLLPRELPGNLQLTEAFLGFALIVAGQTEGETVRLLALAGPRAGAQSQLTGQVDVDAALLADLARAIVNPLPTEVPAALRVGDQLLDSGELLLALASVVRGERPTTRPIGSPDPNTPGLGWGASTLP